jgi:hypothetical protein
MAAMAGRASGESLRIAGLSETVRGQKSSQEQRGRRSRLRRGAPPGVCGRRRFANDAVSHAARADGFAARRLAVRIRVSERLAALRSPGIFRGSTPGPLSGAQGNDEATHPGRKTGRMLFAMSSSPDLIRRSIA